MKIIATAASILLALTVATACAAGDPGTNGALPQGVVASEETTTDTPEPAETKAKPTSCDIAREAILTGTKKEKEKALKALIKDKKADATAREAAQDYFETDDKDLKKMELDLVQLACAI